MKRIWFFSLCLALAGCESGGGPAYQEQRISILEKHIHEMELRLDKAEAAKPLESVSIKPLSKGWQWLRAEPASLRISIEKMEAKANGSRMAIAIQSPLAIPLRDCSVSVAWASTNESGDVLPATRHADTFDLSSDIAPASFTSQYINLPDLPPEKIGLVTFSNLVCERTGNP